MNFGNIKNYMLFGGGDLLLETAKLLTADTYSVFVVTSKRHSEELITADNIRINLKEHLDRLSIPYIVTDTIERKDITEKINNETAGISFGSAWIFRQNFINLFNGRLVNSHGARLPQDRGRGGFSWRIMKGDRMGISLIHQIDNGIDTGNVLLYEEYLFPHKCRSPLDYDNFSFNMTLLLFKKFFSLVKTNYDFKLTAQPEYLSSYFPGLSTKINGFIGTRRVQYPAL